MKLFANFAFQLKTEWFDELALALNVQVQETITKGNLCVPYEKQ